MTKKRQERTAAPASPLAPGLPALLRSLFDAVARTASRMTYQIAYVTALAFLSDKRGKNRRADIFARKCEENAQKNAPMGVSVILNALFLWFIGTAIPRRSGNSGDSDMEVSLDVGSFLSDEPAGSPPSGGNSPNDELAKVANLTEINPPTFTALPPEVIPAITANTPSTFAALQTNALTNSKTIGSEILIPDTEATQGQGEGTSSPSKSGEGNGTGTGSGPGSGTGTGGEGDADGTGNGSGNGGSGIQIGKYLSNEKETIGIILDTSGSMEKVAQEVKRTIQNLKTTNRKLKVRIGTMEDSLFDSNNTEIHPKTGVLIRKTNPTKEKIDEIKKLWGTGAKTIFILTDLEDGQNNSSIQELAKVIKICNLKLNIISLGKHPIPSLFQLIQETGGIYVNNGVEITPEAYQTIVEESQREQRAQKEKLEASKTDFTKKMEERRKEFQEKVRKQREELEAKRKAQSQTP